MLISEDYKRPSDGCWIFKGSTLDGYGQKWHEGRRWLAHRLAWHLWRGVIPEGMMVLHRCDVRNCINPEHLFLGDNFVNQRDCRAKGRLARAKITQQIADWIRSQHFEGCRITDLARFYGITINNVCSVTKGRIWVC